MKQEKESWDFQGENCTFYRFGQKCWQRNFKKLQVKSYKFVFLPFSGMPNLRNLPLQYIEILSSLKKNPNTLNWQKSRSLFSSYFFCVCVHYCIHDNFIYNNMYIFLFNKALKEGNFLIFFFSFYLLPKNFVVVLVSSVNKKLTPSSSIIVLLKKKLLFFIVYCYI